MFGNIAIFSSNADTKQKLETQKSMTIKAENTSETAHKRISELSDQKMDIESSFKEAQLIIEQTQQENASLKANLQAKKEREAEALRLASTKLVVQPNASMHVPAVAVAGNKASWLASSGIPQDQWAYVDQIVSRESGWNPNAVNSSSGACGLGQQLPCGKWSGAWNDPVAALIAMNGYVTGRYGSWAGAVAFWNTNHWY